MSDPTDIPPELPLTGAHVGQRSDMATALDGETVVQTFLPTTDLGPARRIEGQAAMVSFSAKPKFAQQGTFTSLEISVFATDYYPAGNTQARDQVFDELVQWAEDAFERQAGRFNNWRHSLGQTGTWSPK
jgi:hypothetical protein